MASKKATAQISHQEEEQELQAIILAEDFDNRFQFIAQNSHMALMPVANIPLIEYTIQFLIMNKIKEALVFSSSKLVSEYIKKNKRPKIDLKPVISDECNSMGDALREIYRRGLIKNDFILLNCEVISNMSIKEALNEHFRRKKESKDNILTRVFKKVSSQNYLRTKDDDFVYVVDRATNRLLQCENVKTQSEVLLDTIDTEVTSIKTDIRYDLIDTSITICALEVLNHFMENFDYNHFKDDFLKDLLTNEVVEDKIHIYILKADEYAGLIKNFRLYGKVTRDVLSQWVKPITLPSLACVLRDKTVYSVVDDTIYIATDVERSHKSKISSNSSIGKNTKIGDNTIIESSVIGRDCVIGENIVIRNSIIWDTVTIEDKSQIDNTIICNKCVIGKETKVLAGSIIGPDVIIKPGQIVAQNSVYSIGDTNDPKSASTNGILRDGAVNESVSAPNNIIEDNDSITDSEGDCDKSEDEFLFENELIKFIEEMLKKPSEQENILLEINSTRFAENRTNAECISCVIPRLLEEMSEFENLPQDQFLNRLSHVKIIKESQWAGFFKGIIKNEEDALTAIEKMEEFCTSKPLFRNTFHLILQLLWKNEGLQGEFILFWADKRASSDNADHKHFLGLMSKMVDYLRASQDEEEEEEEGGEGEAQEEDDEDS